jgi:hypothetical protein
VSLITVKAKAAVKLELAKICPHLNCSDSFKVENWSSKKYEPDK